MFLSVKNQNSVDPNNPELIRLEDSIEQIILNLDGNLTPDTQYYEIKTTPSNVLTHKVTLKGGARPDVGDLETETAIADGIEIGTATVVA